MQESLENLRELAASLPVSPDSPYRDYTSSTSSGKNPIKPLKSYEMLSSDFIDESNLSSLDEVALSLSKSAKVLEQKQANSSRSFEFRNAVIGSGITQLPKRPSSTALNAALSTNTTNKPLQILEQEHRTIQTSTANIANSPTSPDAWMVNPLVFPQGPDRATSTPSSGWIESTLDGPDFVNLNRENFETQPVDVSMSLHNRNTNNNKRATSYRVRPPGSQNKLHRGEFSEELPHHISARREYSSMYYNKHETYIPGSVESSDRMKNSRNPNKESRKTSNKSTNLVTSIGYQPSGDESQHNRYVDPSSVTLQSLHPPQRRNMEESRFNDPLYFNYSYSSGSSSLEKRLQIRPHAPSVVPPSYFSHHQHPEYYIPSNTAWSPTRRKDSSAVAVQTETPHLVGDSTLV